MSQDHNFDVSVKTLFKRKLLRKVFLKKTMLERSHCNRNIEIGSAIDILVTITKLSIILEGSIGVVDIPSMFLAIGNDSSGIEMKCWKKKGGGGDAAVAFVVSVRERRSGEA